MTEISTYQSPGWQVVTQLILSYSKHHVAKGDIFHTLNYGSKCCLFISVWTVYCIPFASEIIIINIINSEIINLGNDEKVWKEGVWRRELWI